MIQWTGKSTSILPPSKQGGEYRLQRVWACRVWCPKSRLPMGASGPPSNTWFLGSPWVHIPNGISTDAAVLAQLMLMTNRQSDVQITLQRKQQMHKNNSITQPFSGNRPTKARCYLRFFLHLFLKRTFGDDWHRFLNFYGPDIVVGASKFHDMENSTLTLTRKNNRLLLPKLLPLLESGRKRHCVLHYGLECQCKNNNAYVHTNCKLLKCKQPKATSLLHSCE